MNSSPEQTVAIGIDFEPLGNEGRIQIAWPVVRTVDGRWAIAEGGVVDESSIVDDPRTLAENVELLDGVLPLRLGQGLIAIGSEYLADITALDDPELDQLIGAITSGPRARLRSSQFLCVPADLRRYRAITMKIADRARMIFERLIGEDPLPVESLGRALRLFEAEPQLDYEIRVVRRLVYLRIVDDVDGYLATLAIGSRGIGVSETELETKAGIAFGMLREQDLFEEVLLKRELWRQWIEKFSPALTATVPRLRAVPDPQRGPFPAARVDDETREDVDLNRATDIQSTVADIDRAPSPLPESAETLDIEEVQSYA